MAIYLISYVALLALALVLIFKATKKEFNQDQLNDKDNDEFNQ
jgi:hypothetical protein